MARMEMDCILKKNGLLAVLENLLNLYDYGLFSL